MQDNNDSSNNGVEINKSTGHLETLTFSKMPYASDSSNAQYHFFCNNAETWNEIPIFAIITGPNGSGKSTLINCIYKIIKSDENKERPIYISSHKQPKIDNNPILKRNWTFTSSDREVSTLFSNEGMHSWTSVKNLFLDMQSPDFWKDPMEIISRAHTAYKQGHNTGEVSPIEHVNTILKKYRFKYFLMENTEEYIEQMNKGRQRTWPKGYLYFTDQLGNKIDAGSFSFGEKLILSVIFWQYCVQGLDSKEPEHVLKKPKIILLDEPDRHLDPKSCKLFYTIIYEELVRSHKIQVIMTTHRFDSIALAPKESIFCLEQNQTGKMFSVKKIHPLRAIFRMSGNLRLLTSYHHRVYVESTNDAKFYEGLYKILRRLSDGSREPNFIESSSHFFNLGREQRRCLSRRYQVEFYPVSSESASKGGCQKVISSIKEDIQAKCREGSLLIEPELRQSYGILDRDSSKNPRNLDDAIKEYIVKAHRYSIENYLFDPIVFCSAFTNEEIRGFISDSRSKKEAVKFDFTNVCINIKTGFMKNRVGSAVGSDDTAGLKEGLKEIGLNYQTVPGDGHCLFHAVGLYVKQDQNFLRQIVAAHLEHNLQEFESFLETSGRSINEYIQNVREGKEWASHVEIEVLMRVLNRPIIIVGPHGEIRNPADKDRFSGELIFTYYNGSNHYDALLLSNSQYSGREVFESFEQFSKHSSGNYPHDSSWSLKTSREDRDRLQDCVKQYFATMLSIMREFLDHKPEKHLVTNDIFKDTVLMSRTKKIVFSCSTTMNTFELDYPNWFFEIRGHDIEELFFGKKVAQTCTKKILDLISQDKLSWIPGDLAKIFFDLDSIIRTNVRKVIKPEPIERQTNPHASPL